MASNAHVVVIDTSFRRAQVKTTPGKYMTDVLEEACAKLNLNSKNYGLKHNNKALDISRTFRQTGLSSGAKLELVLASRTPSVVSVALQLPASLAASAPGGRLTDKVPSDTTLWLILRKFESTGGANLNFTARGITEIANGDSGSGRIFYEMPTLNVMGRELSEFEDLQKNLAQLGFNSGSCLLRLGFKKTDRPLEEAMAEIGKYFKEDAPADEKPKDAPPAAEVDTVSAQVANLPDVPTERSTDIDMPLVESSIEDPKPTASLTEEQPPTSPAKRPAAQMAQGDTPILGPNGRPIVVYSAPSGTTPKAAQAPTNDSDFEPTIAHAKLHQSRLQTASINRKLLSDAELAQAESEKAARLAKTNEVEVKFRFPDQSSVVGSFGKEDTGKSLYACTRGLMAFEGEPFKLVWNEGKGPQTVPNSDEKKLIVDLGFSGKMLVNVLWEDGASDEARKAPVLKKQYDALKREQVVAVPKTEEGGEEDSPPTGDVKGKGKEGAGTGGKGKGLKAFSKFLSKR